jgi:hypothetical protein
MNNWYYHAMLINAQREYKRTNDHSAYISDCAYITLRFAADALVRTNPSLKHLPYGVMAVKHLIKGAVDMFAHRLVCPIANDHSAADFLSEFARHGKRHLNRDLKPIEDVLRRLGWLEADNIPQS